MSDDELSDWLIEQSFLRGRSPDHRSVGYDQTPCPQCEHHRHAYECHCGCPVPFIPIFED